MDVASLAPEGDLLASSSDPEVNSEPMAPPSETAFNKLVDRVKVLEDRPVSWVEKHPTTAWLLAILIPTVVALLGIFAGVLPVLENYLDLHIKSDVDSSLQTPNSEIATLSSQIAIINGQLSLIVPLVIEESQKAIHDASTMSGGSFQAQLPELNAALGVAAEQHVSLSEPALQNISQKILEMVSSKTHPRPIVWDTFIRLLRYYSYLNATKDRSYSEGEAPAPPPTPIERGGYVSVEDLTIVGGTIRLDGTVWKNVVFRDAVVVYNGGSVTLENVQFENCRFAMPISTPAVALGKQMLASSVVSFKQTG
jgi:hypothetical protein